MIAQARRKLQGVHRQRIVGAADVDPRCRCSLRGQSFANKQNYAEGFLHDPVLKVEDAEGRKGQKTNQRQYLVPPFHGAMSIILSRIVNPAPAGKHLYDDGPSADCAQ